jgi:hypothetical protein
MTGQDSFSSTDWNMFWDSSNGIEEYTTSVTGFLNKCIDDVFPVVTVHTYIDIYQIELLLFANVC